MIDRHEFADELLLREHIRTAIKKVIETRKAENKALLEEEHKVREVIRKLIMAEGTGSGGAPETPHRSTGINVLEDLLKKIVPILEDDYKILTSSEEQRDSYRAHIVNATQNALAPEIAIKDAPNKPALQASPELSEEIDVDVGDSADEDAFIDVRGEADPTEKELSPEEEFGQGVNKDNITGRNMAYKSFQKIEKAIVDAHAILQDEEDREVFYDYLLTNLKLYFDKFEEELAGELGEPTTPEYEQEKDEQAVDDSAGEEAEQAPEPAGEDDLDLEL
jgi:hypothetical protein|tara:strand:+ start:398 stop:1231 length:834 start_codon:yes stop_codon:yes gene_type:complete